MDSKVIPFTSLHAEPSNLDDTNNNNNNNNSDSTSDNIKTNNTNKAKAGKYEMSDTSHKETSHVTATAMTSKDIFLKMPRMRYTCHHPINTVAVLDVPNMEDAFVVACDDSGIGVWSLRFGNFIVDIPSEHTAKISAVTTYIDSTRENIPMIITGSWDESIHVWPVYIRESTSAAPGVDGLKYNITTGKFTTLVGHTNRILTLQTTPNTKGQYCKDGALLVSGSADSTLRVWSLHTLTYLYQLSHPSIVTWVLCLDIYFFEEMNCSVVVSGGKDNTLRFWRLANPLGDNELSIPSTVQPFRIISDCPSQVVAMCLTKVATAAAEVTSSDTNKENVKRMPAQERKSDTKSPLLAVVCKLFLHIRVYSTHSGQLIRQLSGHHHTITGIVTSYSPRFQSHVLVSLSAAGNLRVWNPMSGELLHTFRGHTGRVNAACMFSPPSAPHDVIILSGGEDQTARAWSLQPANSLGILNYIPPVASLATSQESIEPKQHSTQSSNHSSSSNNNNDINIKKQESETRVGVNAIAIYSPISPVSIIVTANEDGCIRCWDVSTRTFATPVRWVQKVSNERLKCLLVYTPYNYSEEIKEPNGSSNTVHTSDANAINTEFSILSPMAICAGSDSRIHFIDLLTGTILNRKLIGHTGTITCLAISDASVLQTSLLVSGSEEYEVKVWSISSGMCLLDLNGHVFDVNAVAIYSPSSNVDESLIISGGVDSTIRLWLYESASQIATLPTVTAPVNAIVVADFPSGNGPVVIAGSADATIKIWCIKQSPYVLLHTLERHMDEVTCLAVYQGEGCYDTLLSGSLDKCVIVWDLNSHSYVQHIEGHTHEVNSVCLFSTDFTDPSIASASTDVRLKFDFKNESPNADYVEECFQFDLIGLNAMLHDYQPWPRINKLVKENGAHYLFGRYNRLFRKAVEASRSDFLVTFLPLSSPAVVRCIKESDVLKIAIYIDQHESVSIIVSCLIAYIQEGKCLEISPTIFCIETDDLLLLAKRYPLEFERLIINIQLILYNEPLSRDVLFLRANATADGFDMASISDYDDNIDDKSMESSLSTMSYSYLPLPIMSHMKLLQAICEVCEQTNHTDIFNSQAGLMLLGYAWAKFGMRTHIKLMVLSYMYILLATFNVYSYEWLLNESYLATRFFLLLQMCLEVVLAAPIASGLYRHGGKYLTSVWNHFRIVIIGGGLVGNILRLIYMVELRSTRIVLSITSICMWFHALYFLRAFEATGPLVKMIVKIGNDSKPFLGVLLVVNLGFAQSFWLVANENSDLVFATVDGSMVNSFSFMMGNFDPDAFDGLPAPLQKYGLILSCVYMMVVVVLMLNLLIALMGDSFAQVAEDGMAQWRLEQTRLMLENEYVTPQEDRLCDHVVFFEHKKGSSSMYNCTPDDSSSSSSSGGVEREKGVYAVQLQLQQMQKQQDAVLEKVEALSKRLESSLLAKHPAS